MLSAIKDYVRNCVGIKSPSRHSKDTLVGREILEAFKKGLEGEKMTGQEVWEYWKEHPDVIFADEQGDRIRFEWVDGLRLQYFMENTWTIVGGWKPSTMMRAIQEFLIFKRKIMIKNNAGHSVILSINSGDDLLLDRQSETHTWYVWEEV